jgi:hypothetical protein
MKKIVIFQDVFTPMPNGRQQRERIVLRAITPGPNFVGFTKTGSVIDGEVKKLCSYLEPKFTGYYAS